MYSSLVFYDLIRKIVVLLVGKIKQNKTNNTKAWKPNAWFIVGIIAVVAIVFNIQIAFTREHALLTNICLSRLRPLPVTPWHGGDIKRSFILMSFSVGETILLLVIALGLRNISLKRPHIITISCIALVMLGSALTAGVLTSSDLYNYEKIGVLGFHSYIARPEVILNPREATNYVCMNHFMPTAYGPLFVSYISTLTGLTHNTATLLSTTRVLAALWFGLLLLSFKLLKMPTPNIILCAVNPVLLTLFVSDAHNDMMGIVCITFAMMVVQRYTVISIILVILAGLIKLPFGFIGTLAFLPIENIRHRIGASFISIGGTLTLSYLFAGKNYFIALKYYQDVFRPVGAKINYFGWELSLIAIGAIIVAVLWRRLDPTLTYTMNTIPAYVLNSWYIIWALPYAIKERKHLDMFLATIPLATLLSADSVNFVAIIPVYVVIAGWIVYLFLRDLTTLTQRKRKAEAVLIS